MAVDESQQARIYDNLQSGQIRVLDLQPAQLNEPVHARLRVISLQACRKRAYAENGGYYNFTGPQRIRESRDTLTFQEQQSIKRVSDVSAGDERFEAISYAWGPPVFDHILHLGDGHQIMITRSLFGALRQLRSCTQVRTVWADAVCINQADAIERSIQVAMMGEIYRRCSGVLIWLGEENSDLAKSEGVQRCYSFAFAAMNHLEKICQDPPKGLNHSNLMDRLGTEMKTQTACLCCEQPYLINDSESAQDVARRILVQIIALTSYSWFTRLWVVQEIALGVSAKVYCGTHHAPWRALKELIDQSRLPVLQTNSLVINVGPKLRADMDSLTTYSRLYEQDGFTPDALLTSLIKLRTRDCSHKHDRVYAIRALHGLEGANLLVPDYSASYLQVYRETILLCLARMKKPGRQIPHCALLLALPGVQNAHSDEELAELGDVPSWFTDFDKLNDDSARKLHAYSWPVSYQFKQSCQHSLAFQHREKKCDVLTIKGFRFAGVVEILDIVTPDPDNLRRKGQSDAVITRTMVSWAQQCRSFMLTALGPISTDGLHQATCNVITRGNHPTRGIKLVRRGRERFVATDGDGPDDGARLRYALQPLLEINNTQRFDYTARLAKVNLHSSDSDTPLVTKLAWVPRATLPGDEVCFVRGAPFAIILRATDLEAYRLLGDAWVHDLNEDHVVAGATIAGEEWLSLK